MRTSGIIDIAAAGNVTVAVPLANHGPVAAGTSLGNAVSAIEELEETARLFLMLQGYRTRFLPRDQVTDLQERFPS